MILKINLCIYLFQWHVDEDLLYPWLRLVVKSMYITKSVWLFESRTGGNFAGEKMTKTMQFGCCKGFFFNHAVFGARFFIGFLTLKLP